MPSFLKFLPTPSATRRTVNDVQVGLSDGARQWESVRDSVDGETAILELAGTPDILYLSESDGLVSRVEWASDTTLSVGSGDRIIDGLDRMGFEYTDEDE